MLKLKQGDRPVGVKTPFGDDKLVLNSFSGEEKLSDLFHFDLQMLSDEGDLKPDDIVGKSVDFYVLSEDSNEKRFFNGVVNRFTYLGKGDRAHMYRARVVPWLWLLTKAADCRVHVTAEEDSAGKTVKDVVDKILKDDFGFTDYKWKLDRTPEKRAYCLQYRETYYDFVSRILAEEGIFFYFEHEEGKHTLVLTDKVGGVFDCDDGEVTLATSMSARDSADNLSSWHHAYTFQSGKYSHTDYDFENASSDLSATTSTKLANSAFKKYELYDYPGGYVKSSEGSDAAKWRIEAEEFGYDTAVGESRCRSFSPGGRFELKKHHNDGEAGNKWVLVSVRHRAEGGSYVTGGGASNQIYSNSFHAIPSDVVYRPTHTRAKPRIHGIQSAIVTGPKGEEIHTDKYGRIKIQFHWDRDGKKDEKSSMWVRVATPWAGANWGMVHIPRIGQEVLVDFLDGDLDRPVVVGSLYNSDNMPPYKLPDNMTQSGIKSRSTKKGGTDHFNEIRFEDKKDSEEIYVHAEKDFNCVIENNETREIGFEDKDKGDQEIKIYNDQKLEIGKGSKGGSQTVDIYKDRTVTLETGNEKLVVKKGNMNVSVDTGNQQTDIKKGNQATNIKMGNQKTQLDMGNQTTTIKLGNQTTKLNVGKSTTQAMQGIELKVGPNVIKITPAGIELKGVMIKIQGQAMTQIKSPMTQVNGDGMLMMKGGVTMIN